MDQKNPLKSTTSRRLPDWLKAPLPQQPKFFSLRSLVEKHGLNTVCQSASCPNIGKCWDSGTLTLMILGDHCTRSCRFCDVPTGVVQPPNPDEPREVADMLSKLHLRYVVLTSVDRDDLPDGGSGLWAETITQIRKRSPNIKIETLIPDFQGNPDHSAKVFRAQPDVLSHNIETVPSLQKKVRPQCRYSWSLEVLRQAKREFDLVTKSGIMLGHGETPDEVVQTMTDLLQTGCDILTIGQYLRPSREHLEVVEFIPPEMFAEYKKIGEDLGIRHVEAGPLVRSSYLADHQAKSIGI
jgi:lipoic acid synthetase